MENSPAWIDDLEKRIEETQLEVTKTLAQIDRAMKRIDLEILEKEATKDGILKEIEILTKEMERVSGN